MYDDILDTGVNHFPTFSGMEGFSFTLDRLNECISEEFIFEAMQDNKKSLSERLSPSAPLKKTRDSTKRLGKAFGDLTTAGGTVYKTIWDVIMNVIALATKVIKYIAAQIAKVPNAIIDTAKTVLGIPVEIRSKVRGDIKLNITIGDLSAVNTTLIPALDEFIIAAENMSRGDVWGSMFNRRRNGNEGIVNFIFGENDMKYYKDMKKQYERFKLIRFSKSKVVFSDPNIVNIYFGGEKAIEYKDHSGKVVKGNYYDALANIFRDFIDHKTYLSKVQRDFDQKLDRSQMNESFAKLSEDKRNIIAESIQMMAKVINIIGNLMKYAMEDMNTIRHAADQILKASKMKKVERKAVK